MPEPFPARVPLRGTLIVRVRITSCPACGAPAEILDSATVYSTGGPVELVKTQCLWRHTFVLPADQIGA